MKQQTNADNEHVKEKDVANEIGWQKWQASYNALRIKIFLCILEARVKGLIP